MSFYSKIVSTASGSREVTWLCFTAWATSLDAKFIPSAPKLESGGNFTPSPRHPSSHTSKTKASWSRNWVNYTGFSHSCLWLGSDTDISKGIILWMLLNPLEGLWCYPQPGSSSKDCWHWPVLFWTVHSPGGDGPDLAPQYHFHLSNKTSKVWVFLKANVQVRAPSLISPISNSFTTTGKKMTKTKHKNPFEHFISGWGFSVTKASHWFSIQLYFKKASII